MARQAIVSATVIHTEMPCSRATVSMLNPVRAEPESPALGPDPVTTVPSHMTTHIIATVARTRPIVSPSTASQEWGPTSQIILTLTRMIATDISRCRATTKGLRPTRTETPPMTACRAIDTRLIQQRAMS